MRRTGAVATIQTIALTATRAFSLAYGHGELAVELPADSVAAVLEPRPYPPLADPQAALMRALREPIGSPPLADLVRPGERVAIIVNDVTRLTRTDLFLPGLLDELNRAGLPDHQCEVIFALGSHRPHTEAEQRELIGEVAFARVRAVDHQPRGPLRHYGITSRGTEIALNERVARRDRGPAASRLLDRRPQSLRLRPPAAAGRGDLRLGPAG